MELKIFLAQSRRYDKRSGEPAKPENLADMEMEEEKRSLIHREIDKFRDTYKVRVTIFNYHSEERPSNLLNLFSEVCEIVIKKN